MTGKELREKFLKFFEERGHVVIKSASLIPENDPTVLFTTAGMHPLVPYLTGEKHPAGNRLTDVQKCIRTGDINEVGDEFHHTFFEMLGNWSLGDYFKEEAIEMSFEFLTSSKWMGITINKLAVSCFEGEDDVPKDVESAKKWESLGILKDKIVFLNKKGNWWGLVLGPSGPDTEMFYWVGEGLPPKNSNPKDDEDNWREIWNDVFMEYDNKGDGVLEELKEKNVDTGMGMERMLALMNGLNDNYKTELFWPIIEKIEELSGKKYEGNEREMRIVADHIKASVMILGDEKGIEPSNVGQGYVLRRLIRRAVRYGKELNIEKNFTVDLVESIIGIYGEVYPEIVENRSFIEKELIKEEKKFEKTLEKGLKELGKEIKKINEGKNKESVDLGDRAFYYFETFGFPFEMFIEEIRSSGIIHNPEEIEKKFKERFKEHQDKSRTASAGMFKGGLADNSEETTKLHTTAHLMLEAMRRVLGDHVEQKGSNITPERLRFDFSHSERLTDEQKTEIEKIVNEQISKDLPVWCEEMSLEEAKKNGATGVFESKYGEKVKVYFIGKDKDNFSKEICGGPHITNTGVLGKFRIVKESSSSAGVRRIKAVIND